jgi:uncharacterized protein YacL
MAGESGDGPVNLDLARIRYGFWIVVIGLGVVLGVLVIAVLNFGAAADVAAVTGSITGVIGTLVGAFFGINIGSQGREQAESARKEADKQKDRAQQEAAALKGALGPTKSQEVLQSFR